jgi:ABC-type molybdate transport system substrate-binding protein
MTKEVTVLTLRFSKQNAILWHIRLPVVYPRDNSRPPVGAKFAEMLQTQEGQQMLSKTGLIPLQPLPPN